MTLSLGFGNSEAKIRPMWSRMHHQYLRWWLNMRHLLEMKELYEGRDQNRLESEKYKTRWRSLGAVLTD